MNIYNKIYHVPNGTLIGNWYEEQCLRNKTNEGRTIIQKHIPKRAMNFDYEIKFDPNSRNDTFQRTIGDRPYKSYSTTYQTYGDFSNPENKYKIPSIQEKIYDDFFKCYVGKQEEVSDNFNNDKKNNNYNNNDYNTFIMNENNKKKNNESVEEEFHNIIIDFCTNLGWLGIRNFKNYLKILSPLHDNIILRNDVKMFFLNFGLYIPDRIEKYIQNTFSNEKDEIDYEYLFNSLLFVDENRYNQIKNTVDNLHKNCNGKFSKNYLIKVFKSDLHPDVIMGVKKNNQVIKEFYDAWDQKQNIIEDQDFIQLFCEISTLVDDGFFTQILKCFEC